MKERKGKTMIGFPVHSQVHVCPVLSCHLSSSNANASHPARLILYFQHIILFAHTKPKSSRFEFKNIIKPEGEKEKEEDNCNKSTYPYERTSLLSFRRRVRSA